MEARKMGKGPNGQGKKKVFAKARSHHGRDGGA